MQRPVLCCPEPAVKNGLHPHPIPDGSAGIPTTPGHACTNPLFVTDCGAAASPTPITLDGQDCAGEVNSATGLPGEIVQVVQAPGQVMTVRICEDDRDFELSCGVDPITEHQIQTAYKIVAGEFVLIKRWDTVTGAEWTGDPATLEACSGTTFESDPIEMCDAGTTFLRWIVKDGGKPTGVKFDTDLTGTAYVVTDESGVTAGKCDTGSCAPTISSAYGDTLAGLLPGTSVSIQKNNCCALKVTTSAGAFIVSKDVTGYSTGDFKCAVSVISIEVLSGTCSLGDVIVTTQFSG